MEPEKSPWGRESDNRNWAAGVTGSVLLAFIKPRVQSPGDGGKHNQGPGSGKRPEERGMKRGWGRDAPKSSGKDKGCKS